MGSSRFFVSSRTYIGNSENINPTKKITKTDPHKHTEKGV